MRQVQVLFEGGACMCSDEVVLSSRNMFDHIMSRNKNRGFNGNLLPLYVFYCEYWKQVGQLLKYMLRELGAKRLRSASFSLTGALVKLQEELVRTPPHFDR